MVMRLDLLGTGFPNGIILLGSFYLNFAFRDYEFLISNQAFSLRGSAGSSVARFEILNFCYKESYLASIRADQRGHQCPCDGHVFSSFIRLSFAQLQNQYKAQTATVAAR
jgi:hypothetical protein